MVATGPLKPSRAQAHFARAPGVTVALGRTGQGPGLARSIRGEPMIGPVQPAMRHMASAAALAIILAVIPLKLDSHGALGLAGAFANNGNGHGNGGGNGNGNSGGNGNAGGNG